MAQITGSSVTFAGWIHAAERDRLLKDADVLAIPSTWPEPFGLVGLEAAAQGLPTVAFAVGGISDWLKSGESGELAPHLTPESLADALVKALHNDDHVLKLRLGAWRSSQNYSISKHVDHLERILSLP